MQQHMQSRWHVPTQAWTPMPSACLIATRKFGNHRKKQRPTAPAHVQMC